MTKKFIPLAKKVIDLEIQALQKLKKKIDNSFNKAVVEIAKCKSKVILCGVGKSGLIAAKISATLSSVGTPSFNLSASDSSHGDLGSISKKDILILISYSGKTSELKNIIQYANRNKITLIGIMSKRDSILYKASDIKLVIPEVKESGGIVPTSSTTAQLALGDALAISAMQYKKFGKFDFKKIHPAGNLGAQLKTVEDIMLTGNNPNNGITREFAYQYTGGQWAHLYLWSLDDANYEKLMIEYYRNWAENESKNPGEGWRITFEDLFDMTVDDFYRDFDAFMLKDKSVQMSILPSNEEMQNRKVSK